MKFSHCRPILKLYSFYVINRADIWIKIIQNNRKNASYEPLSARTVIGLKVGKNMHFVLKPKNIARLYIILFMNGIMQ